MKTEAKPPEAAQPVGHMKWNDLKVVYTDKKSKEFHQVKKDLGKYREGKWGNPKVGGDPSFRKYFPKFALLAKREKFPEISPSRLV